jgi:glucose/mannose-6-phosphate isomerase
MAEGEYDSENMYQALKDFPKQVEDAVKLAQDIRITEPIDKIVITGLGGSALPGEILASYLKDTPIPIFINKGYSLPEYINQNSLVFVISYSGNTEETINSYRIAAKRNCQIVVISAGGKLKDLAEQGKKHYVKVPKPTQDFQPRLAIAYQFFPILTILQNSGLIEDKSEEIQKTIATLQKPIFEERAKKLAETLAGKIPVIYTSDRMKAVAYKWKIDFNENSKTQAFYNIFPELNHNEMVGWSNLQGSYYIILIKDEDDFPRIKKRMDITKDILKKKGIPLTEILLTGSSALNKIFSAIYIGDWTSYYLALQYKTDPTPVAMVEDFKKQLGPFV